MKTKLLLFFQLLIITGSCFSQSKPVDSLNLGQTPPGETPKIFIPNSHARLAITRDGKTIFFCPCEGDYNNTSYYKYYDNNWNGPFKLFTSTAAPTLSINEDTLFTMENKGAYRSFYSVLKDTIWSAPIVISQKTLYYYQETNLGNYYFGNEPSGGFGNWDLNKMVIINGDITGQNLGRPLNTSNNDVEFFIAKDESFMVLGVNEGGPGGRDLYISYRKNDKSWTNPKSLGKLINDGPYYKWGPFVTPDNKYLFYAKEPRPYNIYWVRFDNLLDSLKHTNFEPYIKSSLKDTIIAKESSFSIQIPDSVFIDDDGNNTLTYSATLDDGSQLPTWLNFDPQTKTFSGTSPANGWYSINIKATDTANTSATCKFSIVISHQPVLAKPISDTTIITNKSFTFKIVKNTIFKDYDLLDYSATKADGTPLPDWLKCSSTNGTGILFGKPLSPDTMLVKITARDTNKDSASDIFQIIIKDSPASINNGLNAVPYEIYPNPTNGLLIINMATGLKNKTNVEVYDIQGEKIILETANNSNNKTIDLTGLSTGIYVVKVIADGVSYEEKIMKK
jgi:hypothetical protein